MDIFSLFNLTFEINHGCYCLLTCILNPNVQADFVSIDVYTFYTSINLYVNFLEAN